MIAKVTLERYITKCDTVISDNDSEQARKLIKEIVSTFENEIPDIKQGLNIYSPVVMYSKLNSLGTNSTNVDYIEDLKLLRNKFQVELEKHYPVINNEAQTLKNKVFISHSSADIEYIRLLINLLEDIGLSEEDVFCSSVQGYGIPLGQDIYDWLLTQFKEFNLHVIFALSSNYYKSVACLNEMGAAWVLKKKYDNILLPGIDFDEIKGAINPNQISIKLDSETDELRHRLNEFKDSLIDEFNLKPLSATKWERHREEFISKIREVVIEPKDSDISTEIDTHNTATISKEASVLLVYAADESAHEIIKMNSIVGTTISACGWNFVRENPSAREESLWTDALNELIRYGLVEDKGYKGEIFRVTTIGYKNADKIKEILGIDTKNSPFDYLD